MIVTCTRRIQFCAGHRVHGHENKCSHLHGHNYVVELTAQAQELDGIGRVVDFSVIKERIGGWIMSMWDHGFIIHQMDTDAVNLLSNFMINCAERQKLFYMAENPTAENMAAYLLNEVAPSNMENTGVVITKVVVHETENCKAEASLLCNHSIDTTQTQSFDSPYLHPSSGSTSNPIRLQQP